MELANNYDCSFCLLQLDGGSNFLYPSMDSIDILKASLRALIGNMSVNTWLIPNTVRILVRAQALKVRRAPTYSCDTIANVIELVGYFVRLRQTDLLRCRRMQHAQNTIRRKEMLTSEGITS